MAPPVVLLPSPLLPIQAYDALAVAFEVAGPDIVVADPAEPRTGAELTVRWAQTVAAATPEIVVAHSNAGYLAPGVRAAAGGAAMVVFIDAALPPASGSTALAPAGLRERLIELADADGLLPPWTQWWPPGSLDDVVPAEELPALDQHCPRLPLAYFDSRVEAPTGWVDGPNAYLAFGLGYAAELDVARGQHWPVEVIEGAHLHFLHDAPRVARAVLELVAQARGQLPRSG